MKCPECGAEMNPRWLDSDGRCKCIECGGFWMDKRAMGRFYILHVAHDAGGSIVSHDGTGVFKQIVPALIDSLMSDDFEDRSRAAQAIIAIGPDAAEAIPVLTDLLLEDSWLQELAAKALGAIGPAAETAVDALGAVVRQHPAPTWAFLYAATALGRLGSARAVPYLIEAAQDPEIQGPGGNAICALGNLGPLAREAVPMLAELLKDPRFCREAIVCVLGEIGPADGEACAAILRTLKRTRSRSLRESSVYALYQVMFSGGDPPHELLTVFKSLQKDRDKETRHWASVAVDHLHRCGYD
jgi:hypothetical protein